MTRARCLAILPLTLLLAFTTINPAWAENDLAAKIEAVINGPDYKQGHWGILVVDTQTGKTVFEHNADRLFAPASTTKLYSCAAALAAFGPDHKFKTPVYRRGALVKDTLLGDLILVAQGDPTLGGRTDANGRMAFKNSDHTYAGGGSSSELTDTDPLAGLKDLAKQIKDAGIRQVRGEVLVDDRFFARATGSGSGPGLLTPIMVNDNVVDITVAPGAKAGEPARVRLRPETSYVQMDAEAVTVDEGQTTRIEVRTVGPQRLTVRGQIALKAKPLLSIYVVDDPTAFARTLFIESLRREGVTVTASPLQLAKSDLPDPESYDKLTQVAVHTSLPFAEVVKVTLKVSHNLYASTLPLLIASKNGQRTLPEGLRRQRQILSDLGVDVGTISFGGGAGGANADSVTPRATVQLLRAVAKQPYYSAFKEGLPVLGMDGTLSEAVGAKSSAKGKVQAKTGTLYWQDLLNDRSLLRSKALAGVMTTATGRELTFAMFVNDVPLPRGVTPAREGKVLGRLCEIIYQHAP